MEAAAAIIRKTYGEQRLGLIGPWLGGRAACPT
jgi:hypothetical protein